jgi:hypothetical protein
VHDGDLERGELHDEAGPALVLLEDQRKLEENKREERSTATTRR